MTPVGAILLDLMDHVEPGMGLPEALCRLAVARLPVSAAGLALTDGDGFSTLVAGSDARAVELETLQFTLGEGACHDAVTTGRLVQQSDLVRTGTSRWPLYTEALTARGVAAVFAFPLRIGGIRLGVLDLYAEVPTVLDDAALTSALHLVDAAVLIVLHLHDGGGGVGAESLDGDAGGSIDQAFHLTTEVHQATGMISVQAGVSLSEALLLLRAHAYGEQRSIIELARDVVARRTRFP